MIREALAIDNLGRSLSFACVKTQQGGDGCNHVRHGEAICTRRHDIWAIKFDSGQCYAAFFFANARVNQRADEWLDGAARWAPRGCP